MNKIKVALVDDELTGRNLIKGLLENSDRYEVTADFQSGKSALEWLRKNSVDILLCDMKMPEMDGIELMRNHCRQLKAAPIFLKRKTVFCEGVFA